MRIHVQNDPDDLAFRITPDQWEGAGPAGGEPMPNRVDPARGDQRLQEHAMYSLTVCDQIVHDASPTFGLPPRERLLAATAYEAASD